MDAAHRAHGYTIHANMEAHWNTPANFESAAAADPAAMDTWGRTPWDRARRNKAIKGSGALRRLRPDDRVNTE